MIDVALALGGGGARGYIHLGVLHALEEEQIPIGAIVGTSIGSIVGALYADCLDSKKVKEIMLASNFWTFADISGNPFQGIVSGTNMKKFLLANLKAETFDQLSIPFCLTTTDLATGDPFLIETGPLIPSLIASCAIPGMVKPIDLHQKVLIDGAIIDPVPVKTAKRYNAKIVIAVNADDQLEEDIPNGPLKVLGKAIRILYRQSTAHSLEGADIIIHPPIERNGIFSMAKKERLYEAGYNATKEQLAKIRMLLQNPAAAGGFK